MIFATPDFGAGGGGLLVLLLSTAVIFTIVSTSIVYSAILLRRESTQERKKGVWLGSCLAIGILGICIFWSHFHIEARRNLERLLAGDDRIEVFSLTITGQQQKIELNAPASMQYFTLAFRSALREGHIPTHIGLSYHAEVQTGTAGSVLVGFAVPDNVDGVTVSVPVDGFDDPTYYWLPLPRPMPAPVSAALQHMRRPPQ